MSLAAITVMKNEIKNFNDTLVEKITLPSNTANEILLTDASGKFETRQVCQRTSIVETDAELDLMKGADESFANVFNYWKRVSRSGTSYSDNANPAELNGWAFNAGANSLSCTINSATVVGFMSPEKFDDYVFDVQLSSNNGDDDFIGLCIAYAVDPADGKTHILTAMRQLNGKAPLRIDKDYNGFDTSVYNLAMIYGGLTWANGTVATATNGTNSGNGGWSAAGIGCRLKVTRKGDIITVITGQVKTNTFVEDTKFTIDLSADPKLAIFRGPQSVGYVAMSQQNATWSVYTKPTINIPILDVRNWTKYIKQDGVWTPTQTTKLACLDEGLLYRNWVHTNDILGKYYFMDQTANLYRL